MKIRRARINDVRPIHKLLNEFAEKKELLPRAITEIYENLQQFFVVDDKGKIAGCCSLSVQWDNRAEIKALAVGVDSQGKGLGRKLVDACLKDAKRLGVTRLFALTMKDGFFNKMGFRQVTKNSLPHKVWTECVRCPYFPDSCVEIAMVKELESRVPPLPAFRPDDLPKDGTVPVEPDIFLRPAAPGRKKKK